MIKRLFPLVLVAVILALTSSRANASTPYTTWTLGPGGFLSMSQDAYSPVDEIDIDVSGAEDMFITDEGVIYLADTGNGRIVKLEEFNVVASYGEGVLEGPTGLFVDDEGVMYVSDAEQNMIFILGPDGEVVNSFGRPVEPLFGLNREFLPRKVAVDARENLYIISEGSVNGIVQMNTNGNFIGYFGANTASMSLKMILQRMFLTEEQLEQFIRNEAASPSNLAIDHQSLVYTITGGIADGASIRRFTVAGNNIFPETFGSPTFRDIEVSENGLVVAVDAEGAIYEYDLNGTLLFVFVTFDSGDQRLGTLRNPMAIERYQDRLYVLDKDKNAIVVYQETAFARRVHDGVRLYMDGFYREAKPHFEEILNDNGSFIMAYQAIADAYFKEGDYANALTAYRYAEDRDGYSEAFWELRNFVLQQRLSQALIGLFALSIVFQVAGRFDRRYHWFDPVRAWFGSLRRIRLVDDFLFMFRFIKKPADSFYYIKTNERGSLRFAFIIYIWVIIVRVLSLYVTGFIFSPFTTVSFIPIENEILITVGLIALWNVANYLVSTISDGEGRVRDVIIGTAYSLFPYALFVLPIALISNVLTLNEVFLYTFSLNLVWVWMVIILFIMVKEIHNYTFSETIRNVLITLFTMALFVLIGYILYVLFNQLFDFISAVIQELQLRLRV
jgi:tetratricopeptide (TPR) repeat protein